MMTLTSSIRPLGPPPLALHSARTVIPRGVPWHLVRMTDAEAPFEDLSTRDLKEMLSARGISTSGIFERDEFIRLLEDAPSPPPPGAPAALDLEDIAPVTEMTMQELCTSWRSGVWTLTSSHRSQSSRPCSGR